MVFLLAYCVEENLRIDVFQTQYRVVSPEQLLKQVVMREANVPGSESEHANPNHGEDAMGGRFILGQQINGHCK